MNNTLDNKICIILPAFNEEENIENLVNRIISLDKNYSIVVVDDSTTDKTRVILDSLNYSNLKIISRNKKLGRYSAVMKGIEYCVNNYRSIEYIIEMDADLSHPPELITNLLEQAKKTKSDVVIASRHKKGGAFIGWPLSRHITHYGALLLCKIFITSKLSDHFSAFRVYSNKSIKIINSNKKRKFTGFWGFGETLIDLQNANCKFSEYPLVFKNRNKGKSSVDLKTIIFTFFEILFIFYYKIKTHFFNSKKN